ncbi:MAG: MATE family efflux transporter [Fusobacteriaceae bacterium]
MKNLKLDTAPITKLLIHYSLPAILGLIVSALYNVVDRIFIGNIPGAGAMAITGVGVTMPVTSVITAFSMLIGVGATAAISINLGKGEKDKAEGILGAGVLLSFIIGVSIFIFGAIFLDPILLFFGAGENTLFYAKSYMGIILLGTPINIMGYTLSNIMRADGNPRFSAIVMAVSCFLNIILDWFFVFRLDMGISGAAYATVIAQSVTLISGIFYFTKYSKTVRIKLEKIKLQVSTAYEILVIGVAPFTNMVLASTVQTLNNRTLKLYGGDYAIGAMATIMSVALMCFMPINGIAQGAQPIIGYNYGAGNKERALETLKKSTFMSVSLMILSVLFIQIFPNQIISIFGGDAELKGMAHRGMKIYLLGLPAIGVGTNIIQYFQAIGSAKLALYFSFLRQLVLLIPSLLIFSKLFGLDGVWIAQPFADYMALGINLTFLKFEIDRQRGIRSDFSFKKFNLKWN